MVTVNGDHPSDDEVPTSQTNISTTQKPPITAPLSYSPLSWNLAQIMNVTIPGYSETSPTLFNIQVCIERASFQVRKRYSEFVEFDTKIEQEMGERSPVDLPGKKWVGNRNREFLDQRRRGLELYLRSMAKHEEWRESLAFQQFLEINKHIRKTQSTNNKSSHTTQDWLKGTQETRDYIQQAMKSVGGAEERRYIVLAGARINELEANLAGDSGLGDGEYRRRRDVLQELTRSLLTLKTQQRGIPGAFQTSSLETQHKLFSSEKSSSSAAAAKPRVLGKGGETDRTRNLDNEGLMQLQRDDMSSQDQMVDYLRQVIGRQRQLGEDINEELLHQNDLLDELDNDTHVTSSRLNQAKRRVGKLA